MGKIVVGRLWLFAACTAYLCGMTSAAHAQTISSNEIQATSSLDREHSPSLGRDAVSDLVVFTRNDASQSQVSYQRYDKQGIFGPEVLVSDTIGFDRLNDVFGDHIVYSSYASLFSPVGQIKLYTISTGTSVVLAGPVEVGAARIHGTNVVWVEGSVNATFVKIVDINSANPQASAVTIAGPLFDAGRASIGDRMVVWEQVRNSQQDLEAYDMSTSQYITIAADPGTSEVFGTSSGPWVTWASATLGASNSAIRATNIDTGESRLIVDDGATNLNPNMDADLVAWESNAAGNFDIYIYSLAYDMVWQLTSSSDDQFLNNIYDHAVAYTDRRNGNSDIFVALFEVIPADPCAESGGDQDGDGFCDADDNCPTEPGPIAGCPEPLPEIDPADLCANSDELPQQVTVLFTGAWDAAACIGAGDGNCGHIDETYDVDAGSAAHAVFCFHIDGSGDGSKGQSQSAKGFVHWNGEEAITNTDLRIPDTASDAAANSSNDLRVKLILDGPRHNSSAQLTVYGVPGLAMSSAALMEAMGSSSAATTSLGAGCGALPTGVGCAWAALALLWRRRRRV